MAKITKSGDKDGEITFKFVEFTVKGSDVSLQESLKTIAASLMRGNGALPPARQMRVTEVRHIGNELANAEDAEPEDAEVLEAAPETAAPAAPRKPTEKRKVPNFKVLKDIKFDDVTPTLKDFIAGKNGADETGLNKYLLIAYWFKHHKGAEDLTPEHFLTAYRVLDWTTPGNPAMPLADLRHQRRQWMSEGSTKGTSSINNVGESIVEKMGKA
jgi:hypothetical protein